MILEHNKLFTILNILHILYITPSRIDNNLLY